MKAVEFQSRINPDQTLTVPASLIGEIPAGRAVRVLILVPENEIDQEWETSAAEAFGQGQDDADAIYDTDYTKGFAKAATIARAVRTPSTAALMIPPA
jgi:hypothetical protein